MNLKQVFDFIKMHFDIFIVPFIKTHYRIFHLNYYHFDLINFLRLSLFVFSFSRIHHQFARTNHSSIFLQCYLYAELIYYKMGVT